MTDGDRERTRRWSSVSGENARGKLKDAGKVSIANDVYDRKEDTEEKMQRSNN